MRIASLLLVILFSLSGSAGAQSFLPPQAKVLGYSLVELATAFAVWALGTADGNPLLEPRCEQSPTNPRIWFLPWAIAHGETAITCHIPQGSFLVVSPGGYECSEAEGDGSTEAELTACVDEGFATVVDAGVSLDGKPVANLDQYVVTTRLVVLLADNLLGPDPTPSITKGYFLVHPPLSRGTHTWRVFDEFSDGFTPVAVFTLIVR
jgi:hypothetical protein